MNAKTVQSLVGADASIDEEGAAIPAANFAFCSAQIVVTGASTGAAKLQYSLDVVNPVVNGWAPTHWIDITSASSTVSTAGTTGIQKTDICAEWIRAVWTKNNGSAGTVSVNVQMLGA